jgi:hypothetical protein
MEPKNAPVNCMPFVVKEGAIMRLKVQIHHMCGA